MFVRGNKLCLCVDLKPIQTLLQEQPQFLQKPRPVSSIYLQINSTHVSTEASKKFHTFVTQEAKWI